MLFGDKMVKAFKFGDDQWDPSHRLETSWILPPYALFACRAFFVRPSHATPPPNDRFAAQGGSLFMSKLPAALRKQIVWHGA